MEEIQNQGQEAKRNCEGELRILDYRSLQELHGYHGR
jgi:hypothetical protein